MWSLSDAMLWCWAHTLGAHVECTSCTHNHTHTHYVRHSTAYTLLVAGQVPLTLETIKPELDSWYTHHTLVQGQPMEKLTGPARTPGRLSPQEAVLVAEHTLVAAPKLLGVQRVGAAQPT